MKKFIVLLLLIVFIVPVVACNKVEDLEGVVQIKMWKPDTVRVLWTN